MERHLTILELELARTGESDEQLCAHLAECAVCKEKLDRLIRFAEGMALQSEALPNTAAVDDVISEVIDKRVAAISHRRRMHRWFGVGAAAVAVAASVALFVAVPSDVLKATPHHGRVPVAAGDDANGDGRLDILDAFHVARQYKSSGTRRSGDDAEVQRLARLAVSLDTGDAP